MVDDAITCHIHGLLKDNEEVPDDPFASSQSVKEELTVTVSTDG